MTDGTADDGSQEPTSPTPEEVAELKQKLEDIAAQSEANKAAATLAEERRLEAERKMNQTLQERAEERKRIEAEEARRASAALSEEEMAAKLDKPGELAKWIADRDEATAKSIEDRLRGELTTTVGSLAEEMAAELVKRERATEEKFKGLDTRRHSDEFKALREKYPENLFNDDQIFFMMQEKDKAPPAGAASSGASAQAASKSSPTRQDELKDRFFGKAIKSIESQGASK